MSFNQNTLTSPLRNISPIHHLKSPSYQAITTPPQNITAKKSKIHQDISPAQLISQQNEAELWKSRCNDLETSLCHATTDLELANIKARKCRDVEQHLDQLVKQNTSLQIDNDQIQKQYNQKKTESEIWKTKYETQMNTIISMKANYELEIKRLQQEMQKQREELLNQSIEIQNNIDKSKYLAQQQENSSSIISSNEKVDFLRKSHAQNASLYEEQIRKLNDVLQHREQEINELQNRLSNNKNINEDELNRQIQENEILRKEKAELILKISQELNEQKSSIDKLNDNQIESMKQLHHNEVAVLEGELRKINRLLEAKNDEIQMLIDQNKKQKQNFEQENYDLKVEINALKEKLFENNQQKEEEIRELQDKLVTLHTTDIQDLKQKHEDQIMQLLQENQKLKQLNGNKSNELDNQILEKSQQKNAYDNETNRLKQEIELLQLKLRELDIEKSNQQKDASELLDRTHATHASFAEQKNKQIAFLEGEIDNLKQHIVQLNKEIDQNIAKHQLIKNNLESDIQRLKKENEDWKLAYEGLQFEKEKIVDEFKQKLLFQEQVLTDKAKKQEQQKEFWELEHRRLKESYAIKAEENNLNILQKQQQEQEIKKLREEIVALKQENSFIDKMKAKELEELRKKMEQSNDFNRNTLEHSYENKIRILQQEIEKLQLTIQSKEQQIQEMIDKYELLESNLIECKDNAEKMKDYEKKITQLGAEVVTTKNLYDVFIKSKSKYSKK